MGALFHYHFTQTDDALPHPSHCKEQSNAVNQGGKTCWTLLCAPLTHPFTSAEIKGGRKDKFGQSPLTSCVAHREMKVSKEVLAPFKIGNFRMQPSGTFWKASQHQARPAAHTNSLGLLELRAKGRACPGSVVPTQPWCSGTGSPHHLCPVSSIPHKAPVTSLWHELAASMPIRARIELCRSMWIWISESLLFSPPWKGKGFPIPQRCAALSTSFPSGWRCTNAEAPAGSHSIVLNIVFQPSWTRGASRLQHKSQGFMGTLALVLGAGLAPGAGTAWEQGWLVERGQLLCSGGFVWVFRHCLFSQHADKRETLPNERGFAPKAFPHSPVLHNSDFRAGFYGTGEPTALRSHTAPYICIFLLPQWNTGEPQATAEAKPWLPAQLPNQGWSSSGISEGTWFPSVLQAENSTPSKS